MIQRALCWFRRDLRVRDNPALMASRLESREVVPVFIFDRPLLASNCFGPACVSFMLESLHELRETLAQQGLSLHWCIGDPCEEVPRLARDLYVEAVYWNRDYEPSAVRRDQTVDKALQKSGIVVKTFSDHLIFEPHELRNLSGQPFQRFGAFRRAWWKRWQASAALSRSGLTQPRSERSRVDLSELSASPPLPVSTELGYESVELVIRGGEQVGRARLQRFSSGALQTYGQGRNRPDQDATSVLSPHFRFGTVNTRTAVRMALNRLARGGYAARADVHAWIDELIWREFFYHVLAGYPRVLDGPFRPSAAVAASRPASATSTNLFHAWCDGRTGYPLVDAGMRQLNSTGWMHNRVRMVVASFLVKDLRLDWRWGERYFMSRLLDADMAVNNGNWQWCASTGTDAMPGYRIFNPTVQSKKFDPDGAYIRRYVPELADVPTKYIHQPSAMSVDWQDRARCRVGSDYPHPIVEHERARQEYLDLVEARGKAGHAD